MKVVFRADASGAMGTGHVMRCLTLARGLRERGTSVMFVCREHEGHLCDLIEENGFSVCRLKRGTGRPLTNSAVSHAEWLGTTWEDDANETGAAIRAMGGAPDWLVADHYALDESWERSLSASVGRIMVIDDLADRNHACDVLLDQNLVSQMQTRYAGRVREGCRLMLGPKYVLLQPVYGELHDKVRRREGPIRHILIFFGGADRMNLTGRALSAFLTLAREDIEVDVVVSASGPYAESIRRQAAGHERIHIHSGLPTLAPMIANADLGIGAAGSATYERLCLGLPSVVITLAENQRPVAEELSRRSLACWLGHEDRVEEVHITEILKLLTARPIDPSWSESCKRTLDGRGTNRVIEALLDLPATGPKTNQEL